MRNILPYVEGDICVVCACASDHAKHGHFRVHGRTIRCLRLMKPAAAAAKPLIPLRLRGFFGACLLWRRLDEQADVLYVHSPELAFPTLIWRTRSAVVLHMHGWADPLEFSRFRLGRVTPLRRFYAACSRGALRRADKVITVTDDGFAGCMQVLGTAAEGKCALVPTCYDEETFFVAASQTAIGSADAPTLLFVGRIEESKGFELLLPILEAVAVDSPDARLVIVGDGSRRHELKRRAAASPRSSQVTFAGWLDPGHVAAQMRHSSVLILPSLDEGLPTVALEAIACGTPVVSADVGGMRKLLRSAVTGSVVESRRPEAFAAAIGSILQAQPLRNEVARAVGDYKSSVVARRISEIIVDAAERHCCCAEGGTRSTTQQRAKNDEKRFR